MLLVRPVRDRQPFERSTVRVGRERLVVAGGGQRRSRRVDELRPDGAALFLRHAGRPVGGSGQQAVVCGERGGGRRRHVPRRGLGRTRRIGGGGHQHRRRIGDHALLEAGRGRHADPRQRRHTRRLVLDGPRSALGLLGIRRHTARDQRSRSGDRRDTALIVVGELRERPLVLVAQAVDSSGHDRCGGERAAGCDQATRGVVGEVADPSGLARPGERGDATELHAVADGHVPQRSGAAIPALHPAEEAGRCVDEPVSTTGGAVTAPVGERDPATGDLVDERGQATVGVVEFHLGAVCGPHRRRLRDRVGVVGGGERRDHPVEVRHRPRAVRVADQRGELTRRPGLTLTPHRLVGPLRLLPERDRGAQPVAESHHAAGLHLESVPGRAGDLQPPRYREPVGRPARRPVRQPPGDGARARCERCRLPAGHRLTGHGRHGDSASVQRGLATLPLGVDVEHERPGGRADPAGSAGHDGPHVRTTVDERSVGDTSARVRCRGGERRLGTRQVGDGPLERRRPCGRLGHHEHRHRRRGQTQRAVQLHSLEQRHHRPRPGGADERRQLLRRPPAGHLGRVTGIRSTVLVRGAPGDQRQRQRHGHRAHNQPTEPLHPTSTPHAGGPSLRCPMSGDTVPSGSSVHAGPSSGGDVAAVSTFAVTTADHSSPRASTSPSAAPAATSASAEATAQADTHTG